jgi:uncharacterized protein involved in outer membrane biogenesis
MAGISTKSCLEIFTAESPLEGRADLSADVTSKGRTAKELFDSLTGKVTLSMGEGQADIDFPKLIATLRKGPAVGWNAARGSATSFVSAAGDFFLRNGGIYTDLLKVDLAKSAINGEGTIDIKSKALDMRLLMTDHPAKAEKPPKIAAEEKKPITKATGTIIVEGPWSDPTFSLKPAKSSAQNFLPGTQTQIVLRGRY